MKTKELEILYENWEISDNIIENYVKEMKILVRNMINWNISLNTNLLWYYYKNVTVDIIYFLEKYKLLEK